VGAPQPTGGIFEQPGAWVFDLDGVIWLADQPIAGSAEAVAKIRAAGHQVAFVTNNSSVPTVDIEAKLERFGIPAQGCVIGSSQVAASLVAPDEVALVCAGPGVEAALLARGVAVVREGDADVVVVGFHRDFNYERMRLASTAVMGGARLLATNDDATYPTPEGPIPGGGAILASIVRATGVTPIVAGKPYEPMVHYVLDRLGPAGVMVGDRPDTDGLFARALGYRFGLVLSGVTRPGDLPVDPVPDTVASDLLHLVDSH
jgi:4-nitrophenyl phosphatase